MRHARSRFFLGGGGGGGGGGGEGGAVDFLHRVSL